MVDLDEYVRESNAIEDVHDEQAIAESLKAWEYLAAQETLTHDVVKRTHEVLLRHRRPEIAGEYRDAQVYVGDQVPPGPARVPYEMEELLQRAPPTGGVEAIEWHVEFERIHPFQDGNGRVGRLIYVWHCERLGLEPIVWRAEDVEGYYSLFRTPETRRDR